MTKLSTKPTISSAYGISRATSPAALRAEAYLGQELAPHIMPLHLVWRVPLSGESIHWCHSPSPPMLCIAAARLLLLLLLLHLSNNCRCTLLVRGFGM
jgi:hypothetical protein